MTRAYLPIIAAIVAIGVLAVVFLGWQVATVQAPAWDVAVPLLVLTAVVLLVRDVFSDLTS